MLSWLAINHPNPDTKLWSADDTNDASYHGGSIFNYGLNTTRGRAAEAIADLIRVDPKNSTRLRSAIEGLTQDRSPAVRARAASILLAMVTHDMPLVLQLFPQFADSNDRLLATTNVAYLLHIGIRDHFLVLRPIVERMLRSSVPDVSQTGARLASLAVFYHHEGAQELVTEALAGTASQRCGVAVVASSNLKNSDCRDWCKINLLRLFNDPDNDVRREAAMCFFRLDDEPVEHYEELVVAFCDSLAFQKEASLLLEVLETSRQRLPGPTYLVCEKALSRATSDDKDNSSTFTSDAGTIAKLVFRIYQQHQRDQWAARCLNLIDQMCLAGIYEVKTGLEDFER